MVDQKTMSEAEIKELLNNKKIISVEHLSQNPNDVAVEYFIYNPKLLKHGSSKFSLNTNSKAVT